MPNDRDETEEKQRRWQPKDRAVAKEGEFRWKAGNIAAAGQEFTEAAQEDQAAGGIGVQADPLGADRPLEVVQEEIPLDPLVELGTTGHQTPPGLTFAGSSAVMYP